MSMLIDDCDSRCKTVSNHDRRHRITIACVSLLGRTENYVTELRLKKNYCYWDGAVEMLAEPILLVEVFTYKSISFLYVLHRS